MRSRERSGERWSTDESGTRVMRVSVLLAHDPSTRTCDALVAALRSVFPHVDLVDAPSVEYARTAGHALPVDVSLVCLDLPPAPLGGVRLAQEIAREGRPLVLVTRSLRWLPPSAAALRALPWVSPEAAPQEIARAIATACEACAVPALQAATASARASAFPAADGA